MRVFYLVLIPIFLLVLAWFTKVQAGPYWLGTNSDPDYVYLLNSLNLTQGRTPGFYLHPGTPLLILGTPALIITHLFRPEKSLVTDVLSNPELYLNVINYLILICLVFTVFACGYLTLKKTGSLTSALLLQFTPFMSFVSLMVLYRVSPEPLLLISGFWFSYFIIKILYSQRKQQFIDIFLVSIISGFTIALKIDSLPLVIIPLFILSGKNKISYLLLSGISFLLFTLPVIIQYPQMFSWFTGILIHSGNYGVGSANLINISSFVSNLSLVLISQPVLILVVISLFYVYLKNDKSKYIFGFILYFLIQIFLISKHFNFRYLVPPLSLTGLVLVLIGSSKKFNIWLISLLLIIGIGNLTEIYLSVLKVNPAWQEAKAIQKEVSSKYPESLVVAYYGNSSPAFSLKFGNDYVNHAYSPELSALYPEVYFYNLGHDSVSDWQKAIELPVHRTILFQGVPLVNQYARFRPDWLKRDVFGGQYETIYLYP